MSRQFVFNPLSGQFDVIDVGGSSPVLSVTASATIQQWHVVALNGSGEAYMPSAGTVTDDFRVFGVSQNAALTGEQVQVATDGYLDTPSMWTPGPLFLGASGLITSTVPTAGFHVQIGAAVTASRIIVKLDPIIRLV